MQKPNYQYEIATICITKFFKGNPITRIIRPNYELEYGCLVAPVFNTLPIEEYLTFQKLGDYEAKNFKPRPYEMVLGVSDDLYYVSITPMKGTFMDDAINYEHTDEVEIVRHNFKSLKLIIQHPDVASRLELRPYQDHAQVSIATLWKSECIVFDYDGDVEVNYNFNFVKLVTQRDFLAIAV